MVKLERLWIINFETDLNSVQLAENLVETNIIAELLRRLQGMCRTLARDALGRTQKEFPEV